MGLGVPVPKDFAAEHDKAESVQAAHIWRAGKATEFNSPWNTGQPIGSRSLCMADQATGNGFAGSQAALAGGRFSFNERTVSSS